MQHSSAQMEPPAEGPLDLPPRTWWDTLTVVRTRIFDDNFSLIAAGVAFYALFALFPGIAATVAVAGLILDPQTLIPRLENMTAALPEAARDIIFTQIESVASAGSEGLSLTAIIGLAIAYISASNGVGTLMQGLNVAYGIRERRGWIELYMTIFALTLFIMTALVFSAIAFGLVPVILSQIGDWGFWSHITNVARWPVILMVGAFGFAVLYRFGPNRGRARWRWLAPGSIFACLLWIGLSTAFAWYVKSFGRYSEIFGALGGVIVLMMWLWISAFVTMLGALLDAELEARGKHRRIRRKKVADG